MFTPGDPNQRSQQFTVARGGGGIRAETESVPLILLRGLDQCPGWIGIPAAHQPPDPRSFRIRSQGRRADVRGTGPVGIRGSGGRAAERYLGGEGHALVGPGGPLQLADSQRHGQFGVRASHGPGMMG